MKSKASSTKKTGGKCNPNEPMRRITKISGGWWVRFIKENKAYIQKAFYSSSFNTDEEALSKAKLWRNSVEKRLASQNLLISAWNNSCTFHIIGLSWVQRMDRGRLSDLAKAYCNKPKDDSGTTTSFSIQKHGLEGACMLAIKALEKKRNIKYPDNVTQKALKLFKKEYMQFSIAHIN